METELIKLEPDPGKVAQVEPEVEQPSLERKFFNLRTLASFAFAIVIIYLFVQRADLSLAATWDRIRAASIPLFLLAVVVYYCTFPLRTVRWRALLINVGFHEDPNVRVPSMRGLGEILMLGWFANCVVPAKLGDGYRAYLLKRAAGAGFSRTLGTILAERMIDITVMVVLLVVSAFYIFRGSSDMANGVVEAGVLLLGCVVVGLVGMRTLGSRAHRILPRRLHAVYEQLHHGTLRSFQQLPALFVLTVVIWLGEAARLYFITHALNVPVSFLLVLFVSLVNSLLTALPVTPGGLGIVEAGMAGILMTAISKDDAMSVAILDRVITYWSIVGFGLMLYLWRKRRTRLG
ncbi:MAG: flippase-like domain-containing protein [Chloroflexota bacterium]|nr:MAG: flippase-like domain-containing protein [Chloroflexota bacterium]